VTSDIPQLSSPRKREADWIAKLRQVDMFDSAMENAE